MVSVRLMAWLKSSAVKGLQGDGIFLAQIPQLQQIPSRISPFLRCVPGFHDTLLDVLSPKIPSPARLFHTLRDLDGFILGARSGGRTRTADGREILSLLCLPVPPSGLSRHLCASVLSRARHPWPGPETPGPLPPHGVQPRLPVQREAPATASPASSRAVTKTG